MYIVGADLAGPAGAKNTGVAVFSVRKECRAFVESECTGSDESLLELVKYLALERPVVVGLDAPLSYEPGGGQRRSDKELRRQLVARGMHPGSVMAPTAPRMVYLTLRGIAVARALGGCASADSVRVVEVHPGATLCFRDARIEAIRGFAEDHNARAELLEWMKGNFAADIAPPSPCSSHFVAACAAGWAAYDWAMGRSRWHFQADPPWHPYEFSC